MAERFKAHAWKACVGLPLPRVRIPPSPPPGYPRRQKIGAHQLSYGCCSFYYSQLKFLSFVKREKLLAVLLGLTQHGFVKSVRSGRKQRYRNTMCAVRYPAILPLVPRRLLQGSAEWTSKFPPVNGVHRNLVS